MRELLLDDCSVFALERDKIIIAPENPGDGGGWVGVLEVGETPTSPSNSQASKICVVLVFVIQIRLI